MENKRLWDIILVLMFINAIGCSILVLFVLRLFSIWIGVDYAFQLWYGADLVIFVASLSISLYLSTILRTQELSYNTSAVIFKSFLVNIQHTCIMLQTVSKFPAPAAIENIISDAKQLIVAIGNVFGVVSTDSTMDIPYSITQSIKIIVAVDHTASIPDHIKRCIIDIMNKVVGDLKSLHINSEGMLPKASKIYPSVVIGTYIILLGFALMARVSITMAMFVYPMALFILVGQFVTTFWLNLMENSNTPHYEKNQWVESALENIKIKKSV